MKMRTLLLCFALTCLTGSVCSAGVHSPPTDKQSTIEKAIVNYEAPVTITVQVVETKFTELTPVGENSPALYAESSAKEVSVPAAVEEVIIGDNIRYQASNYNSFKRSTDYELTGYNKKYSGSI